MINLNKENWCILPTKFGDLRMYDVENEAIRLISAGAIEELKNNPLVRIHSSCIASETFCAQDCDCADQLYEAMQLIINEGSGVIFHIHQEGRGQGLSKKIKAVSVMQKEKCDTAESFEKLGYKQDIRDFSEVVQLLKELEINSVRLISNNPYKANFLKKNNISVENLPTYPKIRTENEAYLHSKNTKLGHKIPLDSEEVLEAIYFRNSNQKWGEFSNFSLHSIFLENKIWATVEHYYQAQKFSQDTIIEEIHLAQTPSLAKQKASQHYKEYQLEDWDLKKEEVMFKALKAKFTQHPNLKKLLLATGDKIIVERSDSDLYWGDGKNNEGKNRLGCLLMELREQIINDLNNN